MRSATLSKHDRNRSGVAFLPAIRQSLLNMLDIVLLGGTFKIRRNLPSSLSGAPTARGKGGEAFFLGCFPYVSLKQVLIKNKTHRKSARLGFAQVSAERLPCGVPFTSEEKTGTNSKDKLKAWGMKYCDVG